MHFSSIHIIFSKGKFSKKFQGKRKSCGKEKALEWTRLTHLPLSHPLLPHLQSLWTIALDVIYDKSLVIAGSVLKEVENEVIYHI